MGLAARPGTKQLQPVRLAALPFCYFWPWPIADLLAHTGVFPGIPTGSQRKRVCRLPPVAKMTNFSEHSGVTEDKFEGRLGFCCKGTH